MSHRKMFINRLKEAGVHYVMKNIENGYTVVAVPYETRKSDEQWYRDTLAVQGLIYHFSNRNWIVSDRYMFINQAKHIIKFNEKEKYAKNDLELRHSFTDKFKELTESVIVANILLKTTVINNETDSSLAKIANEVSNLVVERITELRKLFDEFKNNRFK